MRTLLLIALVVSAVALAGCGRKGWPQPPGPPEKVIYPRTYPAY